MRLKKCAESLTTVGYMIDVLNTRNIPQCYAIACSISRQDILRGDQSLV